MRVLKLALPNGSLQKDTLERLKRAGFDFHLADRCYTSEVQNPLHVKTTLMRPQHIAKLVWQGNYDAGICGLDWIEESLGLFSNHPLHKQVWEQMYFLQHKKVYIVLFGSRLGTEKGIEEIKMGSTIFSEYPNMTRHIVKHFRLKARVVSCYGSAEACVPHDFPYGVCVSETGATLRSNGLRVIAEIFRSETVLLLSPKTRSGQNNERSREALCAKLGGYKTVPLGRYLY